jgi:peptidoglycan/LPS O-acetylase OafA/YrhL
VSKSAGSLIVIDLVRFACAAMVMLFHFMTCYWAEPSPAAAALLSDIPMPSAVMLPVMRFNWIGVQLFFVISGMVIALTARGTAPADFMKRRLLRLLPAAFICATMTGIALALAGAAIPDLLGRWAASATLWPLAPQIDPSYWTLGVEMLFYLGVASALVVNRDVSTDALAAILLALGAAFWIAALAADRFLGFSYLEFARVATMLPYASFFSLGMILTGASRDAWTRLRKLLALGALCICMIEVMCTANLRATVFSMEADAFVPLAMFLGGVALLAETWRLQPHLERFIRPEVARTIGLATYPLYLLHQEMGAAIMAAGYAIGLSSAVAMLLTMAIIVVLAWVISVYAEPAVQRAIRAATSAFPAVTPSAR